MPQFTASRGAVAGVTSAATTDLIVFEAGANRLAKIIEVGWGGEQTTSTAMRTRLAQASTAGTSITGTVDVLKQSPATDPTAAFTVGTSSTSPTYAAGNLIPFSSWNSHGGVVRWLANPGEEFLLIQAVTAGKQVALRNEVGVATITCGLVVIE